jgi:hypothetical protein
MTVRRARGVILRLVRRRLLAVLVGAAMVAPAAWLEFSGQSGVWWLDGLGLVFMATGAALIWAGLTGPKPDWIDGTEKLELRHKK